MESFKPLSSQQAASAHASSHEKSIYQTKGVCYKGRAYPERRAYWEVREEAPRQYGLYEVQTDHGKIKAEHCLKIATNSMASLVTWANTCFCRALLSTAHAS